MYVLRIPSSYVIYIMPYIVFMIYFLVGDIGPVLLAFSF